MLCAYGHFASYASSINIINMGVEQEGPFGTSVNDALMKKALLDNLKV